MKMPILTVCQPYPTLILDPDPTVRKRVENRNWKTPFRGRLLIHAGLSRAWLGDHSPSDYVFGAIMGSVNMVDCLHIDDIEDGKHDEKYPWIQDHPHTEGTYCWVMEDPIVLPEPIKYKGAQGIFYVREPDVIARLNAGGIF